MSVLVFKIAARNEWRAAAARGRYDGSADDRRDGFIHLSAGHQVGETLGRHFRAKKNLVLIAFRAEDLSPSLRWEASRGGDLFPHHYGALDPRLALWALPIADHAGGPVLPPLGADP